VIAYDLEQLEALERDWDPKLGGALTRPYRELLCYCAGKLLAHGAQLEDIGGYLGASRDVAVAMGMLGGRGDA